MAPHDNQQDDSLPFRPSPWPRIIVLIVVFGTVVVGFTVYRMSGVERSGLAEMRIPVTGTYIQSIAVSTDSRRVFVGGGGDLRVIDLQSGGVIPLPIASSGFVGSVTPLPNDRIAHLNGSLELTVIDLSSGAQVWMQSRTIPSGSASPRFMQGIVTASPDGTLLLFPDDAAVRVLDANTGLTVHKLTGGSAAAGASSGSIAPAVGLPFTTNFNTLAVSPDNRLVVSIDDVGNADLWDLGKPTAAPRSLTLPVPSSSPFGMGFGGGGGVLTFLPNDPTRLGVTASGEFHIHDVATGSLLRTIDISRPDALSYQSTITPDGRFVIVLASSFGGLGFSRSSVAVYDMASGDLVEEITRRRFGSIGFTAMALTPDGRRLVLGSMEGEVVVWDMAGLLPGSAAPAAGTP